MTLVACKKRLGLLRTSVVCLLVAELVACSSNPTLPEPEPAKLTAIDAQVEIELVWGKSLGESAEQLRLGLTAVSDGVHAYAASVAGRVVSLDIETGRTDWQMELKQALSAGPALISSRLISVSRSGQVIAQDSSDGHVLWQVDVADEVLASPAGDAEHVVIRTVNGRLLCLDAVSGEQRWTINIDTPALTVRGIAAPVVEDGLVIAGFDDGRLIAADLSSGEQRWEQRVAVARGSNDLERLVDVDGDPRWVEGVVYASAYNQRVVAVQARSGRPLWAQSESSAVPLAVDWARVFVVTLDGDVMALDRNNGQGKWTQEGLHLHQLSGPALLRNWLIIGDGEGYVHVLDAQTGAFVGRTHLSHSAIRMPAQIVGDKVLVYSENGRVMLLQLTPLNDKST